MRNHSVSGASIQNWKAKSGGMDVSEARRPLSGFQGVRELGRVSTERGRRRKRTQRWLELRPRQRRSTILVLASLNAFETRRAY